MIRLTQDEIDTLNTVRDNLYDLVLTVEEMVDAHRSEAVVMASLADDPVVRAVREGGL